MPPTFATDLALTCANEAKIITNNFCLVNIDGKRYEIPT